MLRIRDVYPRSRIRIFSIPVPVSASKNLGILTQKMVSRLSKLWSGLFIPDPDSDFLPIPDPGSRGQKGTGSRIRNTAVSGAIYIYIFILLDPRYRNRDGQNQDLGSAINIPDRISKSFVNIFNFLLYKCLIRDPVPFWSASRVDLETDTNSEAMIRPSF